MRQRAAVEQACGNRAAVDAMKALSELALLSGIAKKALHITIMPEAGLEPARVEPYGV